MKGYVVFWREHRDAFGCPTGVEVNFAAHPERAGSYASENDAEMDCRVLDSCNVAINSADGGTHICNGFQAEQARGGRFVICCEAPFVSAKCTAQSSRSAKLRCLGAAHLPIVTPQSSPSVRGEARIHSSSCCETGSQGYVRCRAVAMLGDELPLDR